MTWIALPIIAMMIPIIIVPTALGLRHAKIERELEHAERMKAMELGLTLPRDEPWWTPGRISVAIGVGVPLFVFVAALMASHSTDRPASEDMWMAAAFIGLAGVTGGSVIACLHITRLGRAYPTGAGHVKPAVEADEFDVVASRGGLH